MMRATAFCMSSAVMQRLPPPADPQVVVHVSQNLGPFPSKGSKAQGCPRPRTGLRACL